MVIGETKGHLGQSLYLREILQSETGDAPPVDQAIERRHGEFVRTLIEDGMITACHDVSDGGLMVTVAEMAMASGIGCKFAKLSGDAAFWFGEDQARYVVTAKDAQPVLALAENAGVPVTVIGWTNATALKLPDTDALEISDLIAVNEAWLPGYMESA